MPARPNRDLLPAHSGSRSYDVESWTARHRMCVQLELCGFKNREIAEKLNTTEQWVSRILNDDRAIIERDKFGAVVADKISDVQTRLHLLSNEALDEIVDEMRTSEDQKVRQKAALSILDRAGYTPVHKQINVGTQINPEVQKRLESMMDQLQGIPEVDYDIVDPELEPYEDEDEEEAA